MAGVAPYAIIALSFGLAGGWVARRKGSSYWLWFLISAIVPFIGLLAALLYRNDFEEPRRPCPGCGSERMLHDALCTRCGTELEFPEEPVQQPLQTA